MEPVHHLLSEMVPDAAAVVVVGSGILQSGLRKAGIFDVAPVFLHCAHDLVK